MGHRCQCEGKKKGGRVRAFHSDGSRGLRDLDDTSGSRGLPLTIAFFRSFHSLGKKSPAYDNTPVQTVLVIFCRTAPLHQNVNLDQATMPKFSRLLTKVC